MLQIEKLWRNISSLYLRQEPRTQIPAPADKFGCMTQPYPIGRFPSAARRALRGVLFDVDDTFTTRVQGRGQLTSQGMAALERLERHGKMRVPITGRPFGWVDHMARMWPVDAVVGENGAFYSYFKGGRLHTHFIQTERARRDFRKQLDLIGKDVLSRFPGTQIASDQRARACDIAIDFAEDVAPLSLETAHCIAEYFRARGAKAKISSIHVNAWFGEYDKLTTTRRMFQDLWDIDLSRSKEQFAFLGDSPNDEPMFEFFPHSIGVRNVTPYLEIMRNPPRWMTKAESTSGFVEAVRKLLS